MPDKEYSLGDKKIAVSQIMAKESEIKLEMENLCADKQYDLVVLLITNPLETGEEVLVKGEKQIIEKAFAVEIQNDKCFIPQTLSRKKEFIPKIGYVFFKSFISKIIQIQIFHISAIKTNIS